MTSNLLMTRRIRRTPYTTRVEQAGVSGFTVVNHMLLPKSFEHSVEEDYWHLKEHVQLWDVSTQRQVELKGPDAAHLIQWMTPRDLSEAQVGDCLYVPLTDQNAGLINDPVLLKLDEDHFWLSIADSDVLLWAKGLVQGLGWEVQVREPDVSPLAVQGPNAEKLMASVFGEAIRDLGFFKFGWFDFEDTQQLIARSGYSKQGGFEIYLNGSHLGEKLWDTIMKAGKPHKIRPGCPNLIERIEGGLLSYGNDFTLENNPIECGLANYCSLDGKHDYIGRTALKNIAQRGATKKMRGLLYGRNKRPNVTIPLQILKEDTVIGKITSGVWSPWFERNVGLAMIERGQWDIGNEVIVSDVDGLTHTGEIVELPFL